MQVISKLLVIILFACAAAARSVADKNLLNSLRQQSNCIQPITTTQAELAQDTQSFSQTELKIVSRQAWGAKDSVAEMKRHVPSRITVHHTASLQKRNTSLEAKMRNLQAFSQSSSLLAGGRRKPVWPDVPYHFYVSVDGRIAEARDINFAGDTNTDYDPTGHVLIVLEGNFEKEQPSREQLQALNDLSLWLAVMWKIPASAIKGHKDYASTACPGKNLQSELPRLRTNIAAIATERVEE